ncbi:hypothetical protein GF323_00360 [Candidatus Woesearchaeota archaeon]|nr:hypothetical protein [Candidatus Woesearchaeota archaeon]
MDFLSYFFSSAVSYSGIIAGYVLMLAAPEEKEPGERYFKALSYFLIGISIVMGFFFIGYLSILTAAIFSAGFAFKKHTVHFAYLGFSVMFYAFSGTAMILALAAIIFVYGLASGALLADLGNKRLSFFRVLSLSYFILAANALKLIL